MVSLGRASYLQYNDSQMEFGIVLVLCYSSIFIIYVIHAMCVVCYKAWLIAVYLN